MTSTLGITKHVWWNQMIKHTDIWVSSKSPLFCSFHWVFDILIKWHIFRIYFIQHENNWKKKSIQMEFNTRSLQIVHGSMEKIEKSNSINVLERHNVWATCSQYVVRINECNWNSEVHFCGYAVSSFCLSVRLIFILYKSTDFITHLLFVHFHLFLFQIFYHSTKWNTFKMTSHEHSECSLSKNSCWEIWALNFANNSIRILLLLENLIWSFIQLCRIGWMNLIESCIKAEFGHRFGLLNLKQVKS